MVRNKYLIATSKAPREGATEQFVNALKAVARQGGTELIAMRGEPGPGCYNIGLIVESETEEINELYARDLTMALGPISRYCTCADEDWTGFTFSF